MTREEALKLVVEATKQEPSNEQRAVILARGGKAIMACAGSGKTTVLTNNLAVDLLTGDVDYRKLLCTTYSKAGATEMQQRTQALLDKVGLHVRIEVRTMHSTYYKILQNFGIKPEIISNGKRRQFIADACREEKIRLGDEDLDTLDSLLSYQVNNLLDDMGLFNSYVYTLENVTMEQYGKIRTGYSKRKQDAGLMDFDDMQMYMYALIVKQRNQDILQYCHNSWEYFYIDEFQDISKIQFEILKGMVTDPQKLLVVGDDDQCIYEWRGAAPQYIQNICGYFPLQRFVLSTNYRCAGEIVKRAAVGIKQNGKRVDKDMVPFNQGGNIYVVNTAEDMVDQSIKAMNYINWLCKEKGVEPYDIAVLGRNNHHMAILGNMLRRNQYYVRANEGTKMSQSSVFKDTKAIIHMSENTNSAELVAQALWKCCPYFGIKAANGVAKLVKESGCTIKQASAFILDTVFNSCPDSARGSLGIRVQPMTASKVRSAVITSSANGIESFIRFCEIIHLKDRVERVNRLLDCYGQGMEFMYGTADRQRQLWGMIKYMQMLIKDMGIEKTLAWIHLTEQTEEGADVCPPGYGMITLSTIHGSKGREWKYVLLMADDNLAFPSFEGIMTNIKRGVKFEDISGSIDEGRRLHYVAVTRAKVALTIFAPVSNISVYTLETFGLLDKGEATLNEHIIYMAQQSNKLEAYQRDLADLASKEFVPVGGWTSPIWEVGGTDVNKEPVEKVKDAGDADYDDGDDGDGPEDTWGTDEDEEFENPYEN